MASIQESFQQQLDRATSAESLARVAATRSHALSTCLRQDRHGAQIVAANAGDHPLIAKLLASSYQSEVGDDFQSQLDEPRYLPSDRLLLRQSQKLVGHVQVSRVFGWFEGQRFPLARMQDFVTLPEYPHDGGDALLLELAESVARDEGALFGLLRTGRPEWFERQGWSECRAQGHTRASTLAILSHLNTHQRKARHCSAKFEVRTWRHYELDSVRKVYDQLSTNEWGALERTLEYWQWLVGRKAHSQILIAVDTSDRPASPLADKSSPAEATDYANDLNILGYAVVRDSCIVEMFTLPGQASVRAALVARACRDAIDRDHHYVSLHTPAADPMHELLVTAGGNWNTDSGENGGLWMLKLLSPDRWVERLYPVLNERAREAGLTRPLELDFAVGKQLWRFTLTRRSSRFEQIGSSSRAVQCRWQTLQNVLVSNLTYPEAIALGRLRTSHRSLLRTLSALFPPRLFWNSPFPQLRL